MGKQKTLLNKLYGELREVPMDGDGNVVGNPLVTTGGCTPAARERHVDVDVMSRSCSADGMRRGSCIPPLRDSLTKAEAHAMPEGLEGTKARAEAEAAETSPRKRPRGRGTVIAAGVLAGWLLRASVRPRCTWCGRC